MSATPRIAIFDLDHTLSWRDTYLLYLGGYLWRHPWRMWRCLRLPWAVVLFAMGYLNNSRLKELFLSSVLGGVGADEVQKWTNTFLDDLIPREFRNDGLETLERHRRAGDRLVLLSASPDCYVAELGARLSFDEVICTRVEWNERRLTGKLAGPNMRGAAKIAAVVALREKHKGSVLVAYADHASDLPILRLVDRGVLVNGKGDSQRQAKEAGIELLAWLR